MAKQTSTFKNNNYYNSSRDKPSISHNDFAKEETFSEYFGCENIHEFLLSDANKKYEEGLTVYKYKKNKQGEEIAESYDMNCVSLHNILTECIHKFDQYDSVEIFTAIVDFYTLDGEHIYNNQLTTVMQQTLKEDLELRGVSLDYYRKDELARQKRENVIQRGFRIRRRL